jgi:hypothetical protein
MSLYRRLLFAAAMLALVATPLLAEELVLTGDFEKVKDGAALRKDSKGLDWYESRKDGEGGPLLLKLSRKNIGGNKTKKAMIKGDPELNTYLSYRLAEPLEVIASASLDIYVKEILPGLADYNRSAFIFLGGVKDKKGGPNSTGKERFVFLGFENTAEPGKINLFAREGSNKWGAKTLVAENLDLKTWYSIAIEANVPEGFYEVSVDGGEAFELESFFTKGKTPSKLTHISFASWNDGPGTFYVDNVSVSGD